MATNYVNQGHSSEHMVPPQDQYFFVPITTDEALTEMQQFSCEIDRIANELIEGKQEATIQYIAETILANKELLPPNWKTVSCHHIHCERNEKSDCHFAHHPLVQEAAKRAFSPSPTTTLSPHFKIKTFSKKIESIARGVGSPEDKIEYIHELIRTNKRNLPGNWKTKMCHSTPCERPVCYFSHDAIVQEAAKRAYNKSTSPSSDNSTPPQPSPQVTDPEREAWEATVRVLNYIDRVEGINERWARQRDTEAGSPERAVS